MEEQREEQKGVLLGVFRGSAGGSRWCWQGLEEKGGLGVLDLTSGSCNDCSMMVCECRSGGGLRRHGAAETRLL